MQKIYNDAMNLTFSSGAENNVELARVGKGSCFGELALLRKDVRAANVAAISDSKVRWTQIRTLLEVSYTSYSVNP